ncbi:carbonic anhydrase [Microbacterium stercoris]|uniref:Carbonic anhydrase n=1 Tax=Microbacterium stercoris TaxID=2820289 RepID=A0A939QG17_9MICO|nr:carbonic anhydrase [Microbacterium stercoris]MBO3662242.1 carbonic anhydrase [Microbacterium stercoris]
MTQSPTPDEVWASMVAGNTRFVAGTPEHPHQDVERRNSIAEGQAPIAALFGCADSRLAAEIIFDLGLGDLFVVRNAGQVAGDSIVGSLEYAVEVLKVPLIVVLGHDSCGAVGAAIQSTSADAPVLPPTIWRLIAPIVPAVRRVLRANDGMTAETIDATAVGREHVRDTVAELLQRSEIISTAVAEGRLGIVGANYRLAEGTVVPDVLLGTQNDAA